MTLGSSLLEIARSNIKAHGRLLVVARKSTQTGAVATSSVYFLAQPLNQGNSANANLEAALNVGEENAYDFICAGDEDVSENDLIGPYKGFKWRIENNNANSLDETEPVLHNYCVREKTSS